MPSDDWQDDYQRARERLQLAKETEVERTALLEANRKFDLAMKLDDQAAKVHSQGTRILEARNLSAARQTGPRIVSWDEYMAETYPPLQSLWGDAFLVKAGDYLILSGDTGVGKTILLINLVLALAAGWEEFLGFPLPGRPVHQLVLEAEGSRSKFRDRISKIKENLGIRGSLPISFHARTATLSIERLGNMIADSRAEHALLDPIGRFHDGNENDTTDWRHCVTNPLFKLATEVDLATSFSDHYCKPNENRAGQHKLRGSAAKVQDCGAAMRLDHGKAGGSSRILFFDRVRDGALPFPDRDPSRMPLILDVAAGTVTVDDREDADLGVTPEPRLAEVARLLLKLAPEGDEVSTATLLRAIQDALGLEKSRANDLISSAKDAKLIESARRGYYRLPGKLMEAT
jgi:hypothetical protein